MTDQMKKFLELASANDTLRAELDTIRTLAGQEMQQRVTELAAAEGIPLTDADFAPEAQEIDEEELGAVAGGAMCYCVAAGGGSGGKTDEYQQNNCICVVGGSGEGLKSNPQNPQATQRQDRCVCVIAGTGKG